MKMNLMLTPLVLAIVFRSAVLALVVDASISAAYAEYVMDQGKGWRFCEAIFAEFKRQASKDEGYFNPFQCQVQAIRSLPGVTEAQWQDLDVGKHEDLLRKIVLYTEIKHGAYFDEKRRPEAIAARNHFGQGEKVVEAEIANARQGRVRLQVARVNLQHGNPLNGQPDPEPETIVRRTWLKPEGADPHWRHIVDDCNARYPSISNTQSDDFIVKNDLSDLDPVRSPSLYFGDALGNMVVFHEGKDYVVQYSGTGTGLTVLRDKNNGGYVGPICNIHYRHGIPSKGKRK